MKYALPILFLILLSCSCSKDGDIVSTTTSYVTPLWKRSLHKDDVWNSNSILRRVNLLYKNNILLATTEGPGDRWLNYIDMDTGEDIWKWNDRYLPETEYYSLFDYHISDDILYYIVSDRHYQVNFKTGKTHKKWRSDEPFDPDFGSVGSDYFLMGTPMDTLEDYHTEVILQGKIGEEGLRQVYVPNLKLEHAQGGRIGQVTNVEPLLVDGDTLLLTSYQHIYPQWNFISYLSLYNMRTKSHVYDSIQLNEMAQNGVLFTDLVMNSDQSIVCASAATDVFCHEVMTGQRLWKKTFPNDFSFSKISVVDDKVLGSCENGKIYCLDIHTGERLWVRRGAGTSSTLRIMNGIVYFVGGSPNVVYAYDIETGDQLWRLDVDQHQPGENDIWKGDIYAVPGKDGNKGKIVVCSSFYAYCLEAIR